MLAAGFLAVCGFSAATAQDLPRHPERGGLGLELADQPRNFEFAEAQRAVVLDPRLSIFVTDVSVVSQLSFADVMGKLVDGATTNKETLFKQWWDTADQKPGHGLGPHCDDESAPVGDLATRNGFPYRCPRPEENEAEIAAGLAFNPTAHEGYSAIAYSNRFDLADGEGLNCGEYRVIFARNSGKTDAIDRNLIIVEALLPNPQSASGLKGCRAILEFWASLSNSQMTQTDRGAALRDFYLNGLPAENVRAPIDRRNFAPGTGQIRTNQFLDQLDHGFDWTLREFKIVDIAGALVMQPENVKSNPGVALFSAGATDQRVAAFEDAVVSQLWALRGKAGGEVNRAAFSFNNSVLFNSFESDESNPTEGDVLAAFDPAGPLAQKITAALSAAGSTLTADNIIRRLRVQTCAGCHHYSGGDAGLGGGMEAWPGTLGDPGGGEQGFTHVSERELDIGPDGPGTRFRISGVLDEVLIPARAQVMSAFLAQFP